MLKFLADEDFNNRIVRGLRRCSLALDLVRVRELGLLGKPDAEILEVAARSGRLTLTHDAATMIELAFDRVANGMSMPGLIVVSQYFPIGNAIEEITLIAEGSLENEWNGQVLHLPLK